MAAEITRFALRLDGAKTERGVLSVRLFVAALDGLDSLYRETAIGLGAASSRGLEIDTHLENRCVIANFLASDEFRSVVGPLIQSAGIIAVIKLLIETCSASLKFGSLAFRSFGGGMRFVEEYRTARIKRKTETVRLKREQIKLAREELARSAELRGTQAIAAVDVLLTSPDFLSRALPALGAVLSPLVSGDADRLTISGGGQEPVSIDSEAIQRAIQEQIRSPLAIGVSPAVTLESASADDSVRTGTLKLEAIRLDGKLSGWAVILDGKYYDAVMRDTSFRQRVASGQEEIVPLKTYRAHFKMLAGRSGKLRVEILRMEQGGSLRG